MEPTLSTFLSLFFVKRQHTKGIHSAKFHHKKRLTISIDIAQLRHHQESSPGKRLYPPFDTLISEEEYRISQTILMEL